MLVVRPVLGRGAVALTGVDGYQRWSWHKGAGQAASGNHVNHRSAGLADEPLMQRRGGRGAGAGDGEDVPGGVAAEAPSAREVTNGAGGIGAGKHPLL